MSETMMLPAQNVLTMELTEVEVTGSRIGPFFVHRTAHAPDLWTVTHTNTGHAVLQEIPSHRRALWLVRKLRQLNCWEFTRKAQVSDIPADGLAQIHTLRADAKFGDCQGELAA